MALEQIEKPLTGSCPVCEAQVFCNPDTEESEIFPCPECQTMLVVDSCNGRSLALNEAPQIEEDWGE